MNNQRINLTKTKNYGLFLWVLIIIITLTRALSIHLAIWPINGDEAQYWDWSKHLAFGYYSKPPVVAWLIFLTTQVFGNGYVGLRIASPICHAIAAIFIF